MFIIKNEVVIDFINRYYKNSDIDRRRVICVEDMLWLSSLSLK